MWLRALTLALIVFAPAALAQDCALRDFLAEPLSAGPDPMAAALEQAYPGVQVADGQVTAPGGTVVWAPARGLQGAGALDDATVGDQFSQLYPLSMGTRQRLTPWFDPGRARNDALFAALWFADESAARASLVTVTYGPTGATFAVTTRHCVATQLAGAVQEIAGLGSLADPWLTDVAGGFNWRLIAGTSRRSAHSFGSAIDLNAALGDYWRWAGAAEGAVGAWDSAMPPAIVTALERRGFIWGGKWHHYDGMHFEYRPELILFSRMVAN